MVKRIRLLHIVSDDKFIDSPLNLFEEDGRFENQAILIVNSPDYKIRLIKNTDRIKLLYNRKMVKEFLKSNNYDAIMFYSLTDYHIFSYIPQDKIVIWWAWGYDIYGNRRFIDIPLFKPRTQEYLDQIYSSIISKIRSFIIKIPIVRIFKDGNKDKAIKRIDFFQPVIHTEYELMQKYPGFKATEFYYPRAHSFQNMVSGDVPVHGNNIIINHSATFPGNHLDVWAAIKSYIPSATTVYFPINYGREEYADYLSKSITSNDVNVVFLREFLPSVEYFKIVDSCTYAVYGVLREAAMANIYRCLAMGVKLFLYKDSLVYRYLSDIGCVIFAIEDIDNNSFRAPLTAAQIDINRNCLLKEQAFVDKVREEAISKIVKRISAK